MTDLDRELIIDLVENRLSRADAEAALSRVSHEPELEAAYHEQLRIKEALVETKTVAMTASERASLRNSLIGDLSLESSPGPAPVAGKHRSWWRPLFGLATAALAVTAIAILPGVIGGSDDSSDMASSDITVALSYADGGSEALPPKDSIASDNSTSSFETPMAAPEVEGKDITKLLDATVGANSLEKVSEGVARLELPEGTSVDPEAVDACLDKVRDKLPPETIGAYVLGVDTSGPSTVVHVGLEFEDGIQAAVSLDLADCSIVVFDD